MRTTRFVRIGIAGLMVGTLFAAAPAAMAKGGGGVTRQGSCSGAADWKLSVKPEDGGKLQVEFEVEHAKPGSTWSVRLADNGTQFLRNFEIAAGQYQHRVTVPPRRSGEPGSSCQQGDEVGGAASRLAEIEQA